MLQSFWLSAPRIAYSAESLVSPLKLFFQLCQEWQGPRLLPQEEQWLGSAAVERLPQDGAPVLWPESLGQEAGQPQDLQSQGSIPK